MAIRWLEGSEADLKKHFSGPVLISIPSKMPTRDTPKPPAQTPPSPENDSPPAEQNSKG